MIDKNPELSIVTSLKFYNSNSKPHKNINNSPMNIPYHELKKQFETILLKYGFEKQKAALCANIFANNSRDGVYSHGLNRFPTFIQYVKDGHINVQAEPETINSEGVIEHWDGHLAPGMYTASLAMQRAIALAKENSIGCVTVKNTNHWMRGGTYGWQAADAGCIGICITNTIANMPPWGGIKPSLGNNPLVIAVPRREGHVVLDMAMSQFSYGKLQEYQLADKELPVPGGYDNEGVLTTDAKKIRESWRTLPIGYWKGSGLSLMLDLLVAGLSGGRTVAQITTQGEEYGLSQIFICINAQNLSASIAEEIIAFAKSSSSTPIYYPGEKTLATRKKNLEAGIPVDDEIWKQALTL
jgi:3-dehydro-L-gulonate 2-dehydrogenase